jgi:hypothetical protein
VWSPYPITVRTLANLTCWASPLARSRGYLPHFDVTNLFQALLRGPLACWRMMRAHRPRSQDVTASFALPISTDLSGVFVYPGSHTRGYEHGPSNTSGRQDG